MCPSEKQLCWAHPVHLSTFCRHFWVIADLVSLTLTALMRFTDNEPQHDFTRYPMAIRGTDSHNQCSIQRTSFHISQLWTLRSCFFKVISFGVCGAAWLWQKPGLGLRSPLACHHVYTGVLVFQRSILSFQLFDCAVNMNLKGDSAETKEGAHRCVFVCVSCLIFGFFNAHSHYYYHLCLLGEHCLSCHKPRNDSLPGWCLFYSMYVDDIVLFVQLSENTTAVVTHRK